MAKALLFKVLNDTIGKYIDGLTEENLKLSVFSGTIALQNVSLNRKGIEELKLPLSVINGFIESINIEIPWTSLESSPVKIFINGVYLLVKPLDFNSYTPEQAQNHFSAIKLATLLQEEKKIDLQSQILYSADEIEASAGYFDRLTQKIINNLEISLKNVHIRFEDSISFPSTCIAVGITLGSFVFTTTDSEWNEKFVSDETNSSKKIMYKLGKICDVGIYWCTEAEPFERKSLLDCIRIMKAYVYTSGSSPSGSDSYMNLFESCSYLLEPSNTLRAKCIHQPRSSANHPKLNVTLENASMTFHLDKYQYQQALHLQGVMSEGERRLTMLRYRPASLREPAQEQQGSRAQQWWRYALMLVVNREQILKNKAKIARDCCRYRSEYIALLLHEKSAAAAVSAAAAAAASDNKEKVATAPLSAEQERRKSMIEMKLPLCSLVVFRQIASMQYYDALRAARVSAVSEGGKSPGKKDQKSSWFGSWWGDKKRAKVSPDMSPQNADNVAAVETHATAETTYSLDFALVSNAATISLTSASVPVVTMSVACISNMSYRPNGDVTCSVAMTCLSVRDDVTLKAVMPNLVSVSVYNTSHDPPLSNLSATKSDAHGEGKRHELYPLAVDFVSHPSKKQSSVKVSSLPLIFCWNPLCIAKLLDMAAVPAYHESLSEEKQLAINRREKVVKTYLKYRSDAMTRRKKQEAVTQAAQSSSVGASSSGSMYNLSESLTIKVEFSAPVLLIPEDSSRDLGCLKVDFGHVSAAGNVPTSDDKIDGRQMGKSSTKVHSVKSSDGSASTLSLSTLASPDCTYICTEIRDMSVAFHTSFKGISQRTLMFEDENEKMKNDIVEGVIYIVQPFGMRAELLIPCVMSKSGHSGLADTNVVVELHPKIEVWLTALSYSRIMHLSDIMKWTFGSPYSTGHGESSETSSFTEAALSAVAGVNETIFISEPEMDITSGDKNKRDVDAAFELANNSVLCFHMTLPEIRLILIYDEVQQQNMIVSFSTLQFDFKDRAYDSSVLLSVGSVSISDSSRSESQQMLVQSIVNSNGGDDKCHGETDQLVIFTVTSFKSHKSPLFTAYGNEVAMKMGTISMNMDAKTVLHLRGFYEVALGKSLVDYPPAPLVVAETWAQVPASKSTSHSPTSPTPATTGVTKNSNTMPSIPAGVQLTLSLDSISLEILKHDRGVTSPHLDARSLESVGRVEMKNLTVNVCMEAERTTDLGQYVKVCGCDDVVPKGITSLLSADVIMKSLVVTDTRSLSEANLYKTILCPAHSLTSTTDVGLSNQVHVVFTKETITTFHQIATDDTGNGRHGLQDVENVETTVSTDIRTDGIDVYISLDAIMEFKNAAMENVDALTALTRPLDDDLVLEDDLFNGVESEPEEDDSDENCYYDDQAFKKCGSERAVRKKFVGAVVKKKHTKTLSTTNVVLPSPKIVFLDDPSSLSSKAIVCQSDIKLNMQVNDSKMIDVKYQDEADSMAPSELVEEAAESYASLSLSVSMSDMEVLMIPDIGHWSPYHILYPTNLNLAASILESHTPAMDSADELGIFHDCDGAADDELEKAGSKTNVELEMTDLVVRISLNDLILIQNILLRRTLVEEASVAKHEGKRVEHDMDGEGEFQAIDLSHYVVSTVLHQMSFVLINDVDPMKIVPIVKCKVNDFSLTANGQPFSPTGDGLRGRIKLILQLDSYNQQVTTWEPIIEPWQPGVSFVKTLSALDVNVVTSNTLQITLTSTFLETFSKTFAILLHASLPEDEDFDVEKSDKDVDRLLSTKQFQAFSVEEESSRNSRTPAAPTSTSFTLINKLGVSIDISSSNGKSGEVWHLTPAAPSCHFAIPEVSSNNTAVSQAENLDFLTMRLLSDKAEFRQKEPLYNLPTSRSIVKVCRLWDAKSDEDVSDSVNSVMSSTSAESSSSRVVTFEEEVFEYQRYVIGFGRKWKAPYLPTDPHNWSNKVGSKEKRKESVTLPQDGLWEWQGDWHLDMSGKIGKHIDKEGWEYAFDFPELFTRRHSNRRDKSATDCVRRRRWLRTRSTTVMAEKEAVATSSQGGSSPPAEAPLFVCWEVLVNSNGSRTILIRSCLQVTNRLPYAIMARLGGNEDEGAIVLGPIEPAEVRNVPLLATSAASFTVLCFRPFETKPDDSRDVWNWSEGVSSRRRATDGWDQVDLACSRCDTSRIRPFSLLFQQEGQSRHWTIFPYLELTNALPCSIEVKCMQHPRIAHPNCSAGSLEEVESVSMSAGRVDFAKNLLLPLSGSSNDAYLSVRVPGIGWSDSVNLPPRRAFTGKSPEMESPRETTLEMSFSQVNFVLMLYVRFRQYHLHTCTVEIFSKNVLVDHSGLPLYISYQLATKRHDVADKLITRKLYSTSKHESSEKSRFADTVSPFLSLTNFRVRSRRPYIIQPANVGSLVYSDHMENKDIRPNLPSYSFVALPPALRDQQFIHTPSADRKQLLRGSYWMTFHVPDEAFVCVLVDNRLEARLPRWLKRDGFIKTSERAVAQVASITVAGSISPEVDDTCDFEIYYDVHCKRYHAGAEVQLGTNHSPLLSQYQMYGVFVIPAVTRTHQNARIWDQMSFIDDAAKTSPMSGGDASSWLSGDNGNTMLSDVHKNKLKIGVCSTSGEVVWTDRSLDIEGVSMDKGTFTVPDPGKNMLYHLAYQLRQLPGVFHKTKEVTVIPHYCLLNTTSHSIKLRQVGEGRASSEETAVDPYGTFPWHSLDARLGTCIQLQTEGSLWSAGSVNINEIGTTTMLLYEKDSPGEGEESNSSFLVLNVEVQFAQAEDKCAVTVVIWRSSRGNGLRPCDSLSPNIPMATESSLIAPFSPLTLVNNSSASVLVQQHIGSTALLSLEEALSATKNHSQFRGLLVVPACTSAVYGWLQPEQSNSRYLSFTLNTSEIAAPSRDVDTPDSLVPQRKRNKRHKKLLKNKKRNRRKDRPPTINRTECLHVMLDVSKIDSTSTGFLYFIPESNSDSDQPQSPVDIILKVEWSSSGRLVSIVDREETETDSQTNISSSVEKNQSDISGSGEKLQTDSSTSFVSFSMDFFSIGISIVGDTPYGNCRRELLSGYLQGLHVEEKITTVTSLKHLGGKSCLTAAMLSVTDLQIDNYSETVVYPVMFRRDFSMPRADEKVKVVDAFKLPFFRLSFILENNVSAEGLTGQSCYHFASVNLMPFCFEVDSGSLQLLWDDFFSKSNWFSEEEALCVSSPSHWAAEYNQSLQWSWQRQSSLLDLAETKARSLQAKCLYERLEIHPIKAYITFVQKDLPARRSSSSKQGFITSLAAVDLMEVHLHSFVVSNALESNSSLADRVLAKFKNDLRDQIVQITGSLALFGSPANMMRNIGDGVSDFFYEPIAGMKDSPAGFVRGLGKGTSSLMSGVVSGTLYSTATILNTTAGGMSYISGDSSYMNKRHIKRLKQQAKRGGALAGLRDGGESVVSSVASGVSGIFTKPISGAKKDGAVGFVKGLGRGLVGAVVKPVIGVGDGLSNVMHGISNEMGKNSSVEGYRGVLQIRPCRTFTKSTLHPSLEVLPPLSVSAAVAQEILRTITRVKMGGSADALVCQVSLGDVKVTGGDNDIDYDFEGDADFDDDSVSMVSNSAGSRHKQPKQGEDYGQMIFSERCLYLLKHEDYRGRDVSRSSMLNELRWYCVWEEVLRIEAVSRLAPPNSESSNPQHCLFIHLQSGGVTIACASRAVVKRAYEAFRVNAHRLHKSKESSDFNSPVQGKEDAWISIILEE